MNDSNFDRTNDHLSDEELQAVTDENIEGDAGTLGPLAPYHLTMNPHLPAPLLAPHFKDNLTDN